MIRNYRAYGRTASVAVLTLVLAVLAVGAQGVVDDFVPGEFQISVRAGTLRADVDKIAASANATVVRYYGALDSAHSLDSYFLRMRNGATKPQTTTALGNLKNDPRVVYAGYNMILRKHDVPNDPRYKEQWALPLMNCPAAWDIQKGINGIIIAVCDTGIDATHPDLIGNIAPGGVNYTVTPNTNNPADGDSHGTHVSGICCAVSDNGLGVAGVTRQGVKVLPLKVLDDTGVGSFDFLTQAVSYAMTVPGVQVINASLGADVSSDQPPLNAPSTQAILAAANKGIIFTISAGNSGPNSPASYPANMAPLHPNILCVAACGPRKEKSGYSSDRPYTTISAPGGNGPLDGSQPQLEILSTFPVSKGSYAFDQGTSMSAPNVAGVVALLFSVPGVQPGDIKDVLQSTTNPSYPLPNPDFGAGVIDAGAALLKVGVSVTIISPDGFGGKASRNLNHTPQPSETLMPKIVIRVRQVMPANLVLTIDGNTIDLTSPANQKYIQNVASTVPDPNGGPPIPTRYDVVIEDMEFSPGNHTIVVTGTNTATTPPRTDSDTRTFTVTPHVIPAGRSFISIPFYDPNVTTPGQYFGNNFSLARWVPWEMDAFGHLIQCTGRYAFYSSFGFNDIEASFTPTRTAPHPQSSATPTFPVGLAFWSDQESVKPILTRGKVLDNDAFVIPLIPLPPPAAAAEYEQQTGHKCSNIAWNMIGDPFNFDVPFNTLTVETPSGRFTISEAAQRGLILPNLYSYNGEGYDFRTLPDGNLHPWTGYWVGVTTPQPISLVVPPLTTTRAAKVPSRSALPGDGWVLKLSASTKNLRDSYNFIGVSSTAIDGPDAFKVAKPPIISPNVGVSIMHEDWAGRSGEYAQDIRSSAGNKSWDVIVGSDQPNATVTFSWDQLRTLPRTVRLTLKDQSNGQTVDMRTRSSISFNTGDSAAGRRYSITAAQGVSAPPRISNLIVQQPGSRAAGTSVIGFTLSGDATYTVSIMSAAGKPVGTVATRAAAAGDVHLVWNGKDSSGKSVPAGTYIVQVRATGPDSDTVKAIVPFVVIR